MCEKGVSPIGNEPHHFSICFRNWLDDDFSPERDTDNIVLAVFKTEVNSVLLQTCTVLIDDKNEQEVVRLFLDNGLQRTTIKHHLKEYVDIFPDTFNHLNKAYRTVAYLHIELNDGNIISSFVASKSPVAPLKTLPIPRLELMCALISAKLSDKIATALKLPVSRFYWTDSYITCYWIKGDFNRHKVFVKNRIKEIQKLNDPKEWRYCKGKDNSADLISRGLPLTDLKNNRIWWYGPKWLTMKQTEWPLFSEPTIENEINIDKLELKKLINVNTAVEKRHIKLSASKTGNRFQRSSKILSLNVFLDEDEILRVGGRLKHSIPSEFQKHRMMLPKAHHFTDLIIEHYHKKSLHSGLQTSLYLIRLFYWIPSGQNHVRRILNKCITCFHTKNQTINQMMGDLLRDGIVPSRPFEKVGLDYAGPIISKPNLRKSKVTLKSYITIFICFSTKATHLEIVSDLTTEVFLACL
ncbi:integrase catalytic domain-containing protein [Trichonephila inaurata madagascariensis]|uniref:Integrase catalytic domain-containing protein n=1 Tax=Trichonephila inaurata madagascariensis TaxID=2747483 RepID=A0A8X6YWG3_9ARAC|nr:integrase catalytic domain-containing protein [Trichonephila inaurata madagascariensis]